LGTLAPLVEPLYGKLAKLVLNYGKYCRLTRLDTVNSPYQPFGSKPFDEIYISLELLTKDKLLPAVPSYFARSKKVRYAQVRAYKLKYLKRAFNTYKKEKRRGFKKWVNDNKWVKDYATFITFKKDNNLVQWHYWKKEQRDWIKTRKGVNLKPFAKAIEFEMWLQFIAYKQWMDLRAYAHRYGMEIIGDIPIYVGIDSIDVWANREVFLLDKNDQPTFVGGVPGDYFNADGQLWGNPLYDWDYLEATAFAFWIDRLEYSARLYDYVRIDHFRAFDSYWKIPAGSKNANDGHWAYPPWLQTF
jgi:4-alpha-glucanotransferase